GDRWISLPAMLTPRAGAAVAVLGKQILVVGGVGEDQSPVRAVEVYNTEEGRGILQQYDLRKDVWAQLPPMTVPRYDANVHLLANKVYVAGGRQCKRPIKAFEVYDVETRCWTPLAAMPCKRSYCGVLWDVGGRLCLLGGLRQGGGHQGSKFTKTEHNRTWTVRNTTEPGP
ncbi:hypothetical protein CRUP_016981, partial [Coryphaenoides rupestris]